MMHADVGAYVHVAPAVAGQATAIASGATGNQTAVTGIQIDQNSLPRKFNAAKAVVEVQYSLTTGRTLAFSVDFQHRSATSGAGSTWANFGTTGNTLTVNNATTSTSTGDVVHQATFEGEGVYRTAKRYVRVNINPTSAGGDFIDSTATANGTFRLKGGVIVFGGADEMPASG